MNILSRLSARPLTLLVVVAALLAAHGFAFYLVRHWALSATLASGLIVLILIKHLGIFSSVFSLIRSRWRKAKSSRGR